MKKYFVIAAAALVLAAGITSCSETQLPETPYTEAVSNLTYKLSKKDVILMWITPANAKEVAILKDNKQIATVAPDVNTYTVTNAADGQEHIYTVKVISDKGIVSLGQSITLNLESKTKAAFLLPTGVADAASMPDDDEQAAAAYFQKRWVSQSTGEFIHVSDIDGLDIEEVPVIWIMVDRVALGHGSANLPYTAAEKDVIKNYVKKGGNLYLSNHATMMATAIGRMPWEVTCFGDGEGGMHGDIWTFITTLGRAMGAPIDCSAHPIFDGIEAKGNNGWEWNTIALLGPGSQEDHNCFWIPADIPGRTWGDNGDIHTIPDFEEATTSKVLAGWGHVGDYCVGGLIEFLPKDEYKGTVLCNGFAAYEWHQDNPANGENPYQDNIEKLTANALNYLK